MKPRKHAPTDDAAPAMPAGACVLGAELIGVDWRTGKLIPTGIVVDDAAVDFMNRHLADGNLHFTRQLRGRWRGWSHVVVWPGFGVFAVSITFPESNGRR